MTRIKLSNGLFTIVDDTDAEWIGKYRWNFSRGYARHSFPNGKKKIQVYLHAAITGVKPGLETDHINRNKLDNRRSNLRLVTHAENLRNREPSKKRGVYMRDWRSNTWTAQIKVNCRKIHLGTFRTQEEALKARNLAEKKYGL